MKEFGIVAGNVAVLCHCPESKINGAVALTAVGQNVAPPRSRLSFSWRVDETYIRVKGQWKYLSRSIDKGGATLDFHLATRITRLSRECM